MFLWSTFLFCFVGVLGLAEPLRADEFDDLRQALSLARSNVSLEVQAGRRADAARIQVDLHDAIVSSSQKYGVPAAVLATIVKIESGGSDPCVISSAGAIGLAQLMPNTALSYRVQDPFDPKQNLNGSSHLLRDLLRRYDGQLLAVAASYNAGDKVLAKSWDRWPSETRGYLDKVLKFYPQFTEGRWRQHLPRYVPATNRAYCGEQRGKR